MRKYCDISELQFFLTYTHDKYIGKLYILSRSSNYVEAIAPYFDKRG